MSTSHQTASATTTSSSASCCPKQGTRVARAAVVKSRALLADGGGDCHGRAEVHMLETQETPGFDPFLNEVRGAEIRHDEAGIQRALKALTNRQVMIATPEADVGLARLAVGLVLQSPRPIGVMRGDEIAVSDHHGFRYIGLRAQVEAIGHAGGTHWARLGHPTTAVFYPGRQHDRLAADAIDVRIRLSTDTGEAAGRALDVSAGGVCLLAPQRHGFVVGQTFVVHLDFGDEQAALPARVKSTQVVGDEVRLGLEFAGPADIIARRVNRALAGR